MKWIPNNKQKCKVVELYQDCEENNYKPYTYSKYTNLYMYNCFLSGFAGLCLHSSFNYLFAYYYYK